MRLAGQSSTRAAVRRLPFLACISFVAVLILVPAPLRSAPHFESAFISYQAPFFPEDVVIADFDGNNVPDVAVSSSSTGGITILQGNADGTLTALDTLSTTYNFGLVAADLNDDGDLDLVTVMRNITSVFLGNGDLTFMPAVSYGVFNGSDGSNRVAVADVTGDSIPDVITPDSTAILHIRPGNGDGTLGPPIDLPRNGFVVGVVTGDFDGNTHIDIAVTLNDGMSNYSIDVYLNNGSAVFDAPVSYALPSATYNGGGLDVGLIDGDGVLDLVAHSHWLKGNANGTFDAAVPIGTASDDGGLIADFNDDGDNDVITVGGSAWDNHITVHIGDGAGNFATGVEYRTATVPISAAAGDLDVDGTLDVVVACYQFGQLAVHMGNGDGTFPTTVDYATAGDPGDVEIAEVTGDAHLDVLALSPSSATVRILPGAGDGTLGAPTDLTTPANPARFALGDVDGDSRDDLVTANGSSNSVSVFPGLLGGGFGARVDYAMGASAMDVVVADMNGDQIGDVVALSVASEVSIFLGQNGAGLGARNDFTGATGPFRLFVGHINADTIPDVAVASWTPAWRLFPGLGGGALDTPTSFNTFLSTFIGAFAEDATGNGTLDLFMTSVARLDVRIGNGDGTFTALPWQGPESFQRRSRALALGHLDDDGHLDMVSAGWFTSAAGVHFGDGAGFFAMEAGHASDGLPADIALGDLDENGHLDAVVANEDGSTITVLLDNAPITVSISRAPPLAAGLSFSRVWPVPSSGGILWATVHLPTRGDASLELIDIGGRRIDRRSLGVLEAGRHQVAMPVPTGLRPGIYWLRLGHGGQSATSRIAIVH